MAETNGGVPFFGNKSLMMGVAFILSLVAFVIIALSVDEVEWLWVFGFVLLVAGLALAPLARFTASGGDEDEEEGDGEDEEEADGEEEGDDGDERGREKRREEKKGREDEDGPDGDREDDDEGRGARRA
jgi:flagellar biosynthesis/type III secretory pathway M-ring protein FliF/YscJ